MPAYVLTLCVDISISFLTLPVQHISVYFPTLLVSPYLLSSGSVHISTYFQIFRHMSLPCMSIFQYISLSCMFLLWSLIYSYNLAYIYYNPIFIAILCYVPVCFAVILCIMLYSCIFLLRSLIYCCALPYVYYNPIFIDILCYIPAYCLMTRHI